MQTVIGTDDSSAPASEPALPPTVLAAAPLVRLVPRRPCVVSFAGMVASEPPRAEVYAWLEKLDALTASMTDGQVSIEAVDRGRHERQYRVRMNLTLPTGVVVNCRDDAQIRRTWRDVGPCRVRWASFGGDILINFDDH